MSRIPSRNDTRLRQRLFDRIYATRFQGRWLILACSLIAMRASASTSAFDTLYVSTISGQGTTAIAFSSAVFLTSGSSLTLQGPQGYITSASSVTASSFFGDGSALSNTFFSLTATQTFTGANTFVSSFTVQSNGRQIILSTSSSVNNLAISSSGQVSFSPTLHNSSYTIIPPASTTNTSFGPCLSGSTITITTSGGRVEATFVAKLTAFNSQFGPEAGITILQDGGFVRDLSTSKGLGGVESTGQGGFTAVGTVYVSYLFDAPSSGSHSYCISMAANSVGGTTTASLDTSNSISLFYVKEVK